MSNGADHCTTQQQRGAGIRSRRGCVASHRVAHHHSLQSFVTDSHAGSPMGLGSGGAVYFASAGASLECLRSCPTSIFAPGPGNAAIGGVGDYWATSPFQLRALNSTMHVVPGQAFSVSAMASAAALIRLVPHTWGADSLAVSAV